MGGLGLGSLILGGRADRQERPLEFYAKLEMVIAGSAALTPLLLWAVRKAYIATGGSPVLGPWGATAVRLLLAALVLLVPTFLMGGTLPAAARSVERDDDLGRRGLALLYGLNTLGAVTGTLLATFLLLELFGTRKTLWLACLTNALVAMVALSMSRRAAGITSGTGAPGGFDIVPDPDPERIPATKRSVSTADRRSPDVAAPDLAEPPVPAAFVLGASAVVGFAFLLMELVWYRILSPILGGSTFTFGLILAVALLGIGLGGAAYSTLRRSRTATLGGFALTCALEALFIAIPFALGDRVATLAMLLRDLGAVGFLGMVSGWTAITFLAVLPAAFMSGVQFPMLIALLGQGRRAVGRHVGLAYAWNTVGAIVGSLAGGFGLLPLLTAPGTWRLVVALLAALSLVALLLSLLGSLRAALASGGGGAGGGGAGGGFARRVWPAAAASVLAVALLFATGPTAHWRHGGIGAGRSDHFNATRNSLRELRNNQRRVFFWEQEGVESSVAIENAAGYAFYVNGKCDGHIRDDAGTQVMSGLIGAILHGSPRSAAVIGLGTGSTAGWLGAAPMMERVDVVELEPAVLHMADLCAAGNRDVLHNPKVHISVGDAREALLTSRQQYDLVFSEPSNPYRAGVASLYTREFYEAVARKLQPGGLFLQWVQTYEVDAQTVRTVYATFHSVFPYMETWQTQTGDMLLVGSAAPARHDADALRQTIAQEPYKTALMSIWRVNTVEGFLAHHVANPSFAADVARVYDGPMNTDDQTVVEFGFARSVGTRGSLSGGDVLRLAQLRGQDRPEVTGAVDWEAVEDMRVASMVFDSTLATVPLNAPQDRKLRTQALNAMLQGSPQSCIQIWRQQPRHANNFVELNYLANALAETGSPEAEAYIDRLRKMQSIEADALLANLRWRQHRPAEAAQSLQAAFVGYRTDPWPQRELMRRTILLANDVARGDQQGNVARALYDALSTPFSLQLNEDVRRRTLVIIAEHIDAVTGSTLLPDALAKLEPFVPWDEAFLQARAKAYARAFGNPSHPLLRRALEELDEFRENRPYPFDQDLRPESPPATNPTTGPATGPTTLPLSPFVPRLGQDGEGGGATPRGTSSGSAPAAPTTPAPPESGSIGGSSSGGGSAPRPSQKQ